MPNLFKKKKKITDVYLFKMWFTIPKTPLLSSVQHFPLALEQIWANEKTWPYCLHLLPVHHFQLGKSEQNHFSFNIL